ncbi:MAG: hypothetical protein DMG39_16915 [Acidobacteria bacterium]|nr:MAG: hypothetical protein DMG39_16915 [Acidobacteriota bacterium]
MVLVVVHSVHLSALLTANGEAMDRKRSQGGLQRELRQFRKLITVIRGLQQNFTIWFASMLVLQSFPGRKPFSRQWDASEEPPRLQVRNAENEVA